MRLQGDWSSDVCSSDLATAAGLAAEAEDVALVGSLDHAADRPAQLLARVEPDLLDVAQLLDVAEGQLVHAPHQVEAGVQIGRASCRERVEGSDRADTAI